MNTKLLREKILDLAVKGKLVEQDEKDESAKVLLKKIKIERDRLAEEKRVRKEDFSEIYQDETDKHYYEKFENGEIVNITKEIPFEIPNNWCWTRLDCVGEIIGGGTPKTEIIENWINGDIPWITPADMRSIVGKYISRGERNITQKGLASSSAKLFPKGSIIYSSRAPIGYIAITNNELCTNQGFRSVSLYIANINLYIYYTLIQRTTEIKSRASGTTFKEISGSEFGKTLIPLPPLKEQQCIVEKTEELFSIIDKLEKEKVDYDKNIETLNCKVLDLAIRGKLIRQCATDESVEKLLEKIKIERDKLVEEKKIKKEKWSEIYQDSTDKQFYEKFENGKIINITEEIPFEIPENWRWTRAATIFDVRDGTHDTPKYINKGIPLFTSKNLHKGYLDFNDVKYISNSDSEKINERSKVDNGDILFAMIGSIGNPVIVDVEFTFSIKNMALFKNIYNINMKYFYYFLLFSEDLMREQAVGGVQKFVSLSYLRQFLIPLPPFSEQQRIVQKMDQLFNILK